MKTYSIGLLAVLILACVSVSAFADDRLKPYTRAAEYSDLAGTSVADGDFILLYDVSAGDWVKTSAEGWAELNVLNGVTATAAEINQAADLTSKSGDETATNTLDSTDCGTTRYLNSATEFVTTLPAPTAGCTITIIVKAAPASASYTVVTASSANVLIGGINELEVDTGDDGEYTAAGDTITFADGVAVVGDYVTLTSDGTSWYLHGQANADGGVTLTQAS